MTDPTPQGHPMSDAEPEPNGSGFINLHWAKHQPDGGQPKFKKFWAGKPFRTRHLEWKNADRPYQGGQLGGLR